MVNTAILIHGKHTVILIHGKHSYCYTPLPSSEKDIESIKLRNEVVWDTSITKEVTLHATICTEELKIRYTKSPFRDNESHYKMYSNIIVTDGGFS